MKRFTKLALALACAFVLGAACMLVGCGESAVIGEKADNAVEINLTNATGQDIQSISVKLATDKAYGEPLKQDASLAADAQATLYVPAAEDAAYDVKLATTAGTEFELHGLKLAKMKTLIFKINAEDNVAFAEYTEGENGEAISTLADEQKLIADAKAAKKAKADAKKKAAEAATAATTYDDDIDDDDGGEEYGHFDDDGDDEDNSSDADADADKGGDVEDDTCVDDLVLE